MADCHLGGWVQKELSELNFESFEKAIDQIISEKVDFLLIAGDLFDSAYPSIEILKKSFRVFKKLVDNKIPVFLIAGSHDYSVSGKTFLDVLEQAGFCKNVESFEEKDGKIILKPFIYQNVAIYGYPGKRSGLEVPEVERIHLDPTPGFFNILMLHTTIKSAVKNLMIDSVDDSKLPKVDYVALGHLHIKFIKENLVYSGPIFPNNFAELEELGTGSYYLFDSGKISRRIIELKKTKVFHLEVNETLNLTDKLISLMKNEEIRDKIVLLRLSGLVEKGKISDIDFQKIESIAREGGAYSFLKSTKKLRVPELEFSEESINSEELEDKIISNYIDENSSKFNDLIKPLMRALQTEKQEDERSVIFEERLFSDIKKVVPNEDQ